MPAVEFKGVDIVFGNAKAAMPLIKQGAKRDEILAKTGAVLGVTGIDLTINRGEICVLMGLSGSGKSTLLRATNRLNEVTNGSVMVRHKGEMVDVASCDAKTLRDIRSRTVAMVFQQFALLPWRTVRENVGFGLELRGMSRKDRKPIVDEVLQLVGLGEWGDKFANELSGGMQQRVGLARAFATEPDILLMDEPFSALDPLIRSKLQDELLELQSRLHKTIIFVSHDLDEAMKIGSKIAIMEGGRLVQYGTAEDIRLHPVDRYVTEFVKHVNPLNVLRGHTVMTPAAALQREGNTVYLDRYGRVRITLDENERPIGATLGTGQGRLVSAEPNSGEILGDDPFDIIVAPIDLKLKAAVQLRQRSNAPIVLVDQLGRLAGLCGDDEILKGLLPRDGAVTRPVNEDVGN